MNLAFTLMTIENFKSFQGCQHFDFSKIGSGLHFLRGVNKVNPRLGSNGSGKSSIFDAMCWCLFGQTVDGLHNPDIKPWGSEGRTKTVVTLAVRIDDYGHVLTRSTNPNQLLFDDQPINQAEIDATFRLSLPVFSNTILLGQGQPLFFDLQPRAKMDLFSDVLDLGRWEERSKYAASEVARLQSQHDLHIGQLQGSEAQETQLKALLEQAEKRAVEWEAERATLRKEAESTLEQLKKEFEASENNRVKYDLEYESAMMELTPIKKLIADFSIEWQKACDAKWRIGLEVTHATKERDKHVAELKGLGSSKCPTCGQRMNPQLVQKHGERLKKTIATLNLNIKVGGDTKKLDAEMKRLKKEIDKAEASKSQFQEKQSNAWRHLESLTTTTSSLQAKIKVYEQSLDERDAERNPFREQIRTLRKQGQGIIALRKELQAKIDKLTRQIERVRFWVKGFKDVLLYVIDEVTQELELVTNAMLQDVGLTDWMVRYSIEKETKAGTIKRGLNVEILSPDNPLPVKWENWSGGESQRLRIIGALALSEVLLNHAGLSVDLEILDEPSTHLSTHGVRDVVEFLADRAKQLQRQIFFIDHTAIESDQFASVITVIKTEQGSRIKAL